MARKKQPLERKLRTREHVIADLAINHVERQALLCGYSVERIQHDYGIDLLLFTYTADGQVESGYILLQVKATERLTIRQSSTEASFRIDRADLPGWLNEFLPVILIVYEGTTDRACWIHVQGYFSAQPDFNLFQAAKTVTVHLPLQQILDESSIHHFASLREQTARQFRQEE